MSAPHTDVAEVEAANTAYYEALERGDFEELASLWLTPSDVGVDEEARCTAHRTEGPHGRIDAARRAGSQAARPAAAASSATTATSVAGSCGGVWKRKLAINRVA